MRFERIRHFGRIGLLMAGILTTGLAFGQNANTGEIRGIVQDSSGAVVEGVKVTITNVETGVSIVSTTNSAGIYDAPSVPTGSYTVTFLKAGFKDFVRKGVILQIQTVAVDATLQVGNATERIEVTAETPLVESETSDQHVNLNAAAIRTAPIVGTDWRAEMIQLIPGVNTGGGAGEANGQAVGVNGTQSYNVMFLSDGGPATAPRDFNGSNYYMPVDAIGEVSVNSANAPPEYGSGLTSINVLTKSGTNQWHGSLFESIQNTAFNSRGFLNPAPDPKSVEHWNTFGGSVGGPIIKNKLFFFFLYQRNPSSTPTSGLYSYPTAAMAAGDFYGVPGSTGPAFDSNGNLMGTYDPVALKLQGYFPAASARGWAPGCPGPVNVSASNPQTCINSATGAQLLTNNFIFNGTSPNTNTWYTAKVDYNLSSKQRLSFSFNYFPTTSSYVPADPLYPNDATAFEQGKTDNLTGQLSHLFTINSRMVNEFRVGASRELDKYKPPSLGKNAPTAIGLEPTYGTNAPANVFPHISIDTGATVGAMVLGAGGGNGNIDATLGQGIYTVSDVLTLIRGKHTIKVGGEYDRFYQNYTSWGDIDSGHFEFNGGVTGIPYADFLAGDIYGWYVSEANPTSAHMWSSAVFGSDDFKVTPHLTLNLGLRWQMQSGWGVKNNLFGVYDPFLPNSAYGGAYKGAILFGGQTDAAFGGKLSTIQNGSYRQFAPRVGFAWSPRDRWVLRASYGIFDAPRDAENYTDGALGLGLNPHQVGPNGYINGQSAFPLAAGPPPGTTVVFPTLQTLSSEISNFSGVEYYPRSMPIVYVQQLLVGVQHEFARGFLLDTSYVNTRGSNLNFATDINQSPASMLGCTGYHCGNPNPVFNNISAQIYDGWSNYNALQLRLQKRMSYGLSFQLNYAWSKSLDTGTGNGHGSGIDIYQNSYSPAANYGLADFDATNTLVGQIVYELPFGHQRQFAIHGVLDQIAGGWRLSSLFQWHSGVPFTPVIQGSVAGQIDPGLNAGTLFPEQVGNTRVSGASRSSWFNPAAFVDPANGTFGNTQRNNLIGPGFANVNLGIAKEFRIREAMALEIRANAYNIFNHINWANPNANVGYQCSAQNLPTVGAPLGACPAGYGAPALADSTAGTITNVTGGARIIELGAHFRF